jgi:hypothetical protein
MWKYLSLSMCKMATLVLVFGCIFILSPTQGAAQGIDIDPMSWDFGDVLLGTSETMVFNIEATEESDTTIYVLSLIEEVPPNDTYQWETSFFSITSAPTSGPIKPFIIPGHTSINVEVTFAPTEVGFYDAFLWVMHNAPGIDSYMPLQGSGVAEVPIPEPTTMLLLGSGLIGLAGFRRKIRKR